MRCFSAILAIAATLVLDPCAAAAQDAESFVGKPLAEALQALQGKGLQIVFTSVTVRPELRVQVEPRSRTARGILDELLAPHGLEAQAGPNGVIQVVRAARATGTSRAYPPDPPAAIEGRVVHALTRAPLENAIVELAGAATARTNATGGFALRPVTQGAWLIRVSIDGFAPLSKVIRVGRGKTVIVTLSLAPVGTTHSEEVTVTSTTPYWPGRGTGTETSMTRGTVAQASGGLVDDPVRAVHTLPRVSLPDDFRSDFIVRGSPFRHVEIVVDGVATPWLQHTAYGRGTSGSLTMLTSHVVNDATLRVGAYAHRSSDRLGAELDMTIREGSRERFELRGAVSGTSTTIVGEGPLGGSEQGAQGSWLVAARNSFLEWPSAKGGASRTPFGFSDGIAKLVYDVRPTQRIGFSVLGGTSNVDDDDETQGVGELAGGTNRTTVANIFWRSGFGSSIVLTQRAYLVKHHFLSAPELGQESVGGGNQEVAYRADVARPFFGGLIEAGGRIGRSAAGDGANAVSGGSPEQFLWQRSGYVNFAWAITPSLTVSPGLRITDSTLLPHSMFTRWILGEYDFRPRWTMSASAGVSYQAPELYQVRGRPPELPDLRPERARYLDVGIAHQLARSVRWQVTAFDRKERDILREPDLYPRLAADARLDPGPRLSTNGLSGSSRGVELLVTRKSATGLSGWGSYSFGKTTQTDIVSSETFWADFDQRHLVNLFGVYRVSGRTSLGATFRAASGFPIPGYLDRRDGTLVVGSRRNEVRLPAYARLDVRASRTFETFGRRLTAFGEIANVLDRANVGLARGAIDRGTGEAVRFTAPMLRRRVSVGFLIEF